MARQHKKNRPWREVPDSMERARRCFEWWVAGQSERDIAKLEKCCPKTAHTWVTRGRQLFQEAFAATVDEHRAEQMGMALDIYQAARSKTDDRTALDALKHLARLTGTEAPSKLPEGTNNLAAVLAAALKAHAGNG